MPLLLLLCFIAVPLAEIALLIKIGENIGLLWTIALVIVTAVIGTALLRMQGLSVLTKAQTAMQESRVPVDSVIDGVCLIVAGAFLLTPGLITDTVGFLLFMPAVRRGLARWILVRIMTKADVNVSVFRSEARNPERPSDNRAGPVIDAEFERVNEPSSSATKTGKQGSTTGRSKRSPWKNR